MQREHGRKAKKRDKENMKRECKLIKVLNIGIACFWVLATLSVVVGLSSNTAEAQPFAYVTNPLTGTVSVIDTNPGSADFNKVVSTINVEVGDYYDHFKIAITPDGTRAYLVNQRSGTISVIDLDPGSTGFNQVVSTIEVRGVPARIAFTPDGTRAYVTHHGLGDNVWVIDTDPGSTEFNKVVSRLAVWQIPHGIAITPDGTRAYVVDITIGFVSVVDIDPASSDYNKVVSRIWEGVGINAGWSIAITPDGTRAYVPSSSGVAWANYVAVIDVDPNSTDFNKVVSKIEAGPSSIRLAITPDGTLAYVANVGYGTVSVVDTNPSSADFNKMVSTIEVGGYHEVIAITPDGSHIYVVLYGGSVVVIDRSDNSVVDTLTFEGEGSWVAIAPSVDTYNYFAAFEIERARVQLHQRTGRDRFDVVGSFELEAIIEEIDFLNNDVTVTLGEYSETIAGGDFVWEDGKFQYKGVSGSITEIKIRADGRFSVTAKGVDLSSISLDNQSDPVSFDFQFGGYGGEAEIQFDKRGRFPPGIDSAD